MRTIVRNARRAVFIAFVFLLGSQLFQVPLRAQLPTAVGWTPLPASTSLVGSSQCPPNNFQGDPFTFGSLCQNVIRTWNGAIADTNADRLIIWGGGHDNYYGNEIYALNLTANPITLVRLNDPTVPTNFANMANCIDAIPPGSEIAPNSREDYEGLEFLPGPNRMMILNGSLACGNGDGSENTWTISLANVSNSSVWVHEDDTLITPSGLKPNYSGQNSYGNIAVYDPNSGLVIVSDNSALFSYNYQTNTYNMVTAPLGFNTSIYLSGAIDPVRKLFVTVGGCGGGTCFAGEGVFVADISNPTSAVMQDWTAASFADPVCQEFLIGGVEQISGNNPGFTYDSVAGDFVGWPNSGNNVYIIAPDTVNQRLTCQRLTFPNGPPNSAHSNQQPNTSNGTFGRFRYFPALDVFVLVNDWNIPPYILRLRSPQGYTLSVTPTSQSIAPGGTATYTVSALAPNGFAGPVNLSVSGFPTGSTVSFSNPSISSSVNSTLSVTVPANTAAGTYMLTVTGTSGSLVQTATVTLQVAVPDFTIAATPSSASVNAGSSASYTISTSALNSFSGTISLAAAGLPSGASASFNPASVTPGASSVLTLTTTPAVAAGTSAVTITGKSGALSHSTTVSFTVTPQAPPPTSAAGIISIDFVGLGTTSMAGSEVAGVIPAGNWNDAIGNTGSAPLSLVDQNGNPTTASVTWTSDDVWNQSIADTPGNARMMRGYLDNGLLDTTTVSISGLPPNAGGYSVYVYAQGSVTNSTKTGIYQVSGTGITATSASLTYNAAFNGVFAQATQANPIGNYVILTIPNVAGFTLHAIPGTASNGNPRAPVNGIQIVPLGPPNPDFTISLSPSSQSVTAGNSTTYTVSTTALNSFSGTIGLAASGLPSGATPSFSPASITAGGTSTLTVTTTAGEAASSGSFNVTGSSGTLNHSANATLNVTAPDFSISATPSTTQVAPGGSATYTVTVGALNGFTGSVNLSVNSGLPSGATPKFAPASITTSGSSTLTITTTASTPTGSVTLTITGMGLTTTHSTTVTLNVVNAGLATNVISIDFVGLGTPMGATETAGVVPKTNWNNAGGNTSTAIPLVDETGTLTNVTVAWTSDNTWDQPITDAPGSVRMMKGYLDNGQQNTTTVTVSGLPSDTNGFNIYVYAQGSAGGASDTGIYQISGAGITTTSQNLTYNANFNGTFTQATPTNAVGNYVILTIPNVPGFTLSAIPSTSTTPYKRAPVNGIQIVPR